MQGAEVQKGPCHHVLIDFNTAVLNLHDVKSLDAKRPFAVKCKIWPMV